MEKAQFYKIECITNMHVGSGDVNYSIVDNEVERDYVTGYPIIHSSGVKGALRDTVDADKQALFFGSEGDAKECKSGSCKFLDAFFLARPMRVESNSRAYILVTTIDALNQLISLKKSLGSECKYDLIDLSEEETNNLFGKNAFITNANDIISIENYSVNKAQHNVLDIATEILGEKCAISNQINHFALPVIARNVLDDKGISKNLWYEEIVPHKSIFYTAIIQDDSKEQYEPKSLVQFGGKSSIGYGLTKLTKI